jgi:hypothetical protein
MNRGRRREQDDFLPLYRLVLASGSALKGQEKRKHHAFDPAQMARLFNPALHRKFLIFHQHRGLDQTGCFVFINIVGLANLSVSLSFVFIDIVGLTFIFCFPFFPGRRMQKSPNAFYTAG